MNREKQKSQVIRDGSLRFLLLQIIFFCRVLDIRVTKVMHSCVRNADGGDHLLEILIHGMDGKRVSKIVREHKPGFLPMLRSLEPRFKLDVPMMPQQLHHPRRGRDRPGLVVFQRGKYILPVFLLALELLVDQEDALLEIDAIPCQAKTSPSRRPVNSVTVYNVSYRWPLMAVRNAEI